MSCGVVHRPGSDPPWLWLWHRLAVTALIRPLAWESPFAAGMELKRTEDKRRKKKKNLLTKPGLRLKKKKKKKKKKLQKVNKKKKKIQNLSEFP